MMMPACRDARLATCAAVACLALTSCTRAPAADAPSVQAAPQPVLAAAVPHGDHNPHHGGVVMMKGDDLHYEVVLDGTGRAYSLYFTDAIREDLPAAVASNVELTIRRPSAPEEHIALHIDDGGESWIGSGRDVVSPKETMVRLAFAIKHEPYWIDLPFSPR